MVSWTQLDAPPPGHVLLNKISPSFIFSISIIDTLSYFGQIKQLCKISRPRLDVSCFLGIRELLAFYLAVFFLLSAEFRSSEIRKINRIIQPKTGQRDGHIANFSPGSRFRPSGPYVSLKQQLRKRA